MPKVTVINQPLGNRGDQAAHKALIGLLQQHDDIEITVVFISSCSTEAIRQFGGDPRGVKYVAIPPFRGMRKVLRRAMYLPRASWRILERFPALREYNEIIRGSDYVLCAPGGICMGGYRNWQHIWELANALALKKRTGIYGRSIGPFEGRRLSDMVFRRSSVDILRRVDFLSLRDRFSQHVADELGVAYVPTVDTAFAYKQPRDLPPELRLLEKRQYAAFIPNQLYVWHANFKAFPEERFDDLYRSIIRSILSHGLDVLMLPQLFGGSRTDRPYFARLAKDFDANRVMVLADTYDSDIQQRIIACSRLVVGARYHSVVFAINNNIPLVCLSYEHKMLYMLELLDLERYSLSLEHLIAEAGGMEKVDELLESVLNEASDVASRVEEANTKARDIARRSFASLVSRWKP